MKKVKKEHIHKAWLLVYGTAMITLGILILCQGDFIVSVASTLGGFIIAANGVHRIARYINARKKPEIVGGIINIIIGMVVMFLPFMTLRLLTFILSVYVFLNAAVKLIDLIASVKHSPGDIFYDFVSMLFFLVFTFIMLFGSFYQGRVLLLVTGIYCILYGVTELSDFLEETLPAGAQTYIRRKVRISVPVFVSTFVPLKILKQYQKQLDTREININEILEQETLPQDISRPANIFVMIHVSDDGVGMMGHCDLYFDGEVLSYGNYDASSERLFGAIGDGVLFTADLKTYINYAVTADNQMIFLYGLHLNDEQLKRVRAEVERIKSNVTPWKPPYQIAYEKDSKAELSDFKDYCSRLWFGTRARFYKFKSGKFKSYFVMSTNCVLLADSILSKAGTDIVKLNGIISPGSYYDYLQREYMLENGIVVSRNIYSKYQPENGTGVIPE